MNAPHADHGRMRRLLSHAFSQQALNEQEPLIKQYFDLLIFKLREHALSPSRNAVDIRKYFDFVTFDITGDMAFGQPFGALSQGRYHFFMENIAMFMKSGRILVTGSTFGPPVSWAIDLMMARLPVIVKNRLKHRGFVLARTEARLDRVTDRKDFMTYLTRHNDEKGMSRAEMSDTSNVCPFVVCLGGLNLLLTPDDPGPHRRWLGNNSHRAFRHNLAPPLEPCRTGHACHGNPLRLLLRF